MPLADTVALTRTGPIRPSGTFPHASAWEKGIRGGCGALMLAPVGMTGYVVDSSVAVKWLVTETFSEEAASLAHHLRSRPADG